MNDTGASYLRCESAVDRGDDRCAVCGMVAPDRGPADLPETAVEVLRCEGCGAAVSYTITAGAPQCGFCGSVTRLEAPEDPLERAELLVPFTVQRQQAEEVFSHWLGSLGWFRPSNLKAASRLESMQALWWTGWVIETEALVSWAADSDVGAGRADWAPHVGRTEMRVEDIVSSASRGLTAEESAMLVETYDLDSAIHPDLVAGPDGSIERFELRRSEARRHVRSVIDGVVTERLRSGVIPGRRFRNVCTEVLARRLITRCMGFPAWVIAYRYRGRLHRFVLSGQDPDCRMGDAPISAAKIVMTVSAGIIGLLVVLALLIG